MKMNYLKHNFTVALAAWKMVNMNPHEWVCACACVVAHVLVKSRRRRCGTSVKPALFGCITWNDTQRWHTVTTLTHTRHRTHTQIHRRTRQATRRACQSLPEFVSAHTSHVLFKNRECKGQLPLSQVRSSFLELNGTQSLDNQTGYWAYFPLSCWTAASGVLRNWYCSSTEDPVRVTSL